MKKRKTLEDVSFSRLIYPKPKPRVEDKGMVVSKNPEGRLLFRFSSPGEYGDQVIGKHEIIKSYTPLVIRISLDDKDFSITASPIFYKFESSLKQPCSYNRYYESEKFQGCNIVGFFDLAHTPIIGRSNIPIMTYLNFEGYRSKFGRNRNPILINLDKGNQDNQDNQDNQRWLPPNTQMKETSPSPDEVIPFRSGIFNFIKSPPTYNIMQLSDGTRVKTNISQYLPGEVGIVADGIVGGFEIKSDVPGGLDLFFDLIQTNRLVLELPVGTELFGIFSPTQKIERVYFDELLNIWQNMAKHIVYGNITTGPVNDDIKATVLNE